MATRSRRFAAGVALVVPLSVHAQGGRPPADVKTACDTAYAIVTKVAGTKTRRSIGSFKDEMFREPIPGCRVQIDGSFTKAGKTGAAADVLARGLEAQGWQKILEFSADGHDGTSFALRKGGVACLVRGEWDGGADDEPGNAPVDPYKVSVICGHAARFTRPE